MKNNLIKWLKLTTGIIILPIILLAGIAFHISTLKQTALLEEFEAQAADYRERLRSAATTEKYICRSLRHIFDGSPTMETLETEITDFFAAHKIEAEYILWHKNSIYSSNFDHTTRPGNWNAAMKQMHRFYRREFNEESDIPENVYKNLRTIFGPHFFPRYYYFSQWEATFMLLRTDSGGNRPLLWIDTHSDRCMAVFFDAAILDTKCGAEFFVEHLTPTDLHLAIIHDDQITASSNMLSDLLQNDRELLSASRTGANIVNGYWLTAGLIDDSITAVISRRVPQLTDLLNDPALLAIVGCFSLLILIFMGLSFYTMVLEKRAYIALRYQILLLFLISTLLPGSILYTLASDYLQHYQKGLITSSYNEGLLYLQQIDELFSSEYSEQKSALKAGQQKLTESLRHKQPNRNIIMSFLRSQDTRPAMFYLVASSSELVATDIGIIKNGRVTHDFGRVKLKGNSQRLNMARAMLSLNKYILAKANRQPISAKLGIEMEEITSMLFQREPAEILKEFFEGESFWTWGVGDHQLPAYVSFIEIFTPGIADYLLTFIFETILLEKAYARRVYHNINRNSLGMRVVAFSDSFHDIYPPEAENEKPLMDFARKVWQRNLTAPEFAIIDGQEHMLIGHNGQSMDRFALLGAVPLAPITEKTREKRNLFLMFVALALTITFSLGLNIANQFLNPLSELNEGVKAIKERNFAYRLPVRGSDEFTTLAKVFNDALIDLEEMSVASHVQQKLMTTTPEPEVFGKLSIYCNSASKDAFAQTFLELTHIEDGHKIAIMRDIQEAGVASCLVLAFMKAAMLQLQHLYNRPQELLNELEQLILQCNRAKATESLKTVAALISQTGELQIVNADMPPPIVINRALMVVSELPPTQSNDKQTIYSHQLNQNEIILCFSHNFISTEQIKALLIKESGFDPAAFCATICADSDNAPPSSASPPGVIIITRLPD